MATLGVLNHLKSAGKLVGVITATSRFSFEHDLALHKVPLTLLDYTQTADDTEHHKPDPRVFIPTLKWLKDQDIEPAEVVYVGDGLHDMKAALGVGFDFLGVETGLVSADEFRRAGGVSVRSIQNLLD